MNRRTFLMGMAATAALAGCSRDRRPRLNVYNWSAYVAPDTISNFEAEFEVKVHYTTYESNEEMLAKVLTVLTPDGAVNTGTSITLPDNPEAGKKMI